VFDTTKGHRPFPLPVTSFRFVPGVVPLIVEESPIEDDEPFLEVRVGRASETADQEQEAAAAEQAEAVEAPEEPEAAGRVRRRRRAV
jgi:hypothetical protein